MLYLTVSLTPSGLCPTPPNLVGDSLKCHFSICDPPGRAPLHLYPVVALRLPHGYPNYIFQMYIASTGLSDLFFRQKELIPRTPSGLCPTPPNLVGDSLKNRFFLSSPKLGEVAHSAGGVCLNALMFLMFLCLSRGSLAWAMSGRHLFYNSRGHLCLR